MKAFVTDMFALPLPAGHRFPADKYRLLRERVDASMLFRPGDLAIPRAATDEQLLRVHTAAYIEALEKGTLTEAEQRRIGFPWWPGMAERARRTTGGTIEACRAALAEGVAVNLAGGTHHAFPDAGEGFCLFNDAAVAIRAMQAEGRIRRAVVIDLDVHQGNGTASIFRDDPSVFTFSVHGERNFPLRKEPSDLDIGLPDGVTDEDYLRAVEEGTREAIRRAEAEMAVYLAGADPHEGDRLGRMAVTTEGLRRRDGMVLGMCHEARLPVAVCMAGGYGKDIAVTADLYMQTVRVAWEWWLRGRASGTA
ncbi:MAG: histone deacetylase [Gemmataceae bacterium]|nr:histone deacetylase [Gemmataceae bacterium]